MQALRTAATALIVNLLTITPLFALALTDVPPITVTANNQVIENVRITAINQPAILVNNFSNVIIRNVEIFHQGDSGIKCANAPGLTIQDVSITHTSTSIPLPTASEINIHCETTDGLSVTRARLRGGSSGIYIVRSPNARLSFIEGYNFRGPFPRGQLVQFNQSPFCTLEDFSAINENPNSWPEDNVSIFKSDNCVIRRGVLDGNNSASGVGVMFEGSTNGLVEDVDTVRQGNGSFSAYPGNNITFRRSRARDNICVDQGRGRPMSNALIWAGSPDSTGLKIENSIYDNSCNPRNIVWDSKSFTVVDVFPEAFVLRSPIINIFPWENSGGDTTPTVPAITVPADRFTQATGPLTVADIGQATATDGGNDPATVTITNDAPGSFPLGSTTVTWTATNAQGNSATGTQIVTVVDTTAPVVAAPPNVTVDSTGTLTPVDIGVATTSDEVGVVSLSNDAVVTTTTSFPVGTTTVTWTAKDAAGNTGTATQTVTVQSVSPPQVVTTPPAGGSFVPADLAGLEVWYDAGAGVTLNGSGVAGWADQSGNGHDSVQATVANQPAFRATAFNGKPSMSFDGLGDYLQAPDSAGFDKISTEMTVFMAGKVLPSSRVREILNTSFTNKTWRWRVMPDEKLQLLVNNGNLEYPQGATPVAENQYSIFTTRFVGGGDTDFYQSGSSLTGTQNNTSAINKNADHLNIGRGYVSISEYWKGEMGEIIIYARALSASETDQVGNYLAGKYGLNWTNQSSPAPTVSNSVTTIIPPPDVTAEATGSLTATGIGQATATDGGNDPATVTITNDAPGSFPLGSTTVTWTATNAQGNSATGTQIVTVVDTTAPVVAAPPDVTVDSTGTLTPVDIGVATTSDTVGVVTLSNDAVVTTPPPSFPVGTTTVTWTAKDAAGNTGTATQTVTVQSVSPPQVVTTPPAGGSFVPADLAGLEVWYDAGAGVSLNGNGVAGWADQSGNGHDSVQVTAANQPAFRATAFNGKPSMSFDGLGDYLQAPDSAGFDKISTEMTVFMAGKVLPSSRVREILNTSFTNKTWRWRVMPDEKLQLLVNDGNLEKPQGATPVTENQYSIFTTRFVGGGDTDFYQSGSSLTGTQNNTSAINKNADHLNIGRGYVSISEYWKGEMGEIIIYARALSASETDQVGNYLADKYGLNWTNQSSPAPTDSQSPGPVAGPPLLDGGSLDNVGPYLEVNSPTSLTVKWRTNRDAPNINTVYYWATENEVSSTVSSTTTTISCGTNCELFEHTAVLIDLLPNTQYFFSIGTSIGQMPILGTENL
jgi:purple acid phosphatase-like protein/concanavalin A-like lectin/glucanase superfamily protein/parallel beta helix pectate lyase-like protein/HYR domain-containing protein